MNIFDPKQLCPKCKGKDLNYRYITEGQYLSDSQGSFAKAKHDLIVSFCRTCNYMWHSLPADTEAVKEQNIVRDSSDYSYETVQDGYVIYDGLGRQVKPWKLVQILNNALALSGSL